MLHVKWYNWSMSITPRAIKVIPTELPLTKNYVSVNHYPNYHQEVVEVDILFAYRRTNGNDKRVRIVAARSGHFIADLYYISTAPKSKVVPLEVDSDLKLCLSPSMSFSLRDWWQDEFRSGNTAFNEGQTYSLNRYSFDILSTKELDAVASSTLYIDSQDMSNFANSFKY